MSVGFVVRKDLSQPSPYLVPCYEGLREPPKSLTEDDVSKIAKIEKYPAFPISLFEITRKDGRISKHSIYAAAGHTSNSDEK